MRDLHRQSDADLVEQARQGSKRALETIVDRYGGSLYSFIRAYVHSNSLANELYQETWLRCFEGLRARYREQGNFRAWLFGIALNVIRQSRPKPPRSVPLHESEDHLLTDPPSSDSELEEAEERRLLYEAINRLREPEREVVLLRLQSDLTFREIAEVLRKPLNTVLSHMHRAVRRLRTELKELA